MAGYVIVNDEVTDESVFAEFRNRVAATVEAHGGRYLGARRRNRGSGRRLGARTRGGHRVRQRRAGEGVADFTRVHRDQGYPDEVRARA